MNRQHNHESESVPRILVPGPLVAYRESCSDAERASGVPLRDWLCLHHPTVLQVLDGLCLQFTDAVLGRTGCRRDARTGRVIHPSGGVPMLFASPRRPKDETLLVVWKRGGGESVGAAAAADADGPSSLSSSGSGGGSRGGGGGGSVLGEPRQSRL